MQMNEKIVQSNTRILQTAIQKATERYLWTILLFHYIIQSFRSLFFLLLFKQTNKN